MAVSGSITSTEVRDEIISNISEYLSSLEFAQLPITKKIDERNYYYEILRRLEDEY